MGASRTLLGIVDLLRTAWQEAVDGCVDSPELSAAGGALGEVLETAVLALRKAAPATRSGFPGGSQRPPSAAVAHTAAKRSPATAGFSEPPLKPARVIGVAQPLRLAGAAPRQAVATPQALRLAGASSYQAPAKSQVQSANTPEGCLPAEMMDLLPQEALQDMLGTAIKGWLQKRKRRKGLPEGVGRLAELESAPNVTWIFSRIRSSSSSLQDWIAEHMHEEPISFSEDAEGYMTVQLGTLTEEEKESRWASRELAQEQFFQSLPTDAFTEEEVALREALIRSLQSRRKSEPPLVQMLMKAGTAETNAVAFAKAMLLPRQVTLATWIQNRIGADIELIERPGNDYAARLTLDA